MGCPYNEKTHINLDLYRNGRNFGREFRKRFVAGACVPDITGAFPEFDTAVRKIYDHFDRTRTNEFFQRGFGSGLDSRW
jgi:hypothetical protein